MKLFDYLRPHSGHNVEAKLALQKFDHDELHVLKKTWQDLSDRSNGKGIDKDTFLQYFPLHGLLGDRLFAQFDTHKRGYIDFDEFICGLATVCRGTLDDKIHFVFNMYDVSHDNTVSRQELSTLLNHIPREAFSHSFPSHHSSHLTHHHMQHHHGSAGIAHVDSASDSEKGSEKGDHSSVMSDYAGHNAPNNSDTRSHYDDEVDCYTNQDVVEKAFEDCDLNNEGRLTYEAFKMWVQRNPTILEYIESILPYNGPKDLAPHHHKKETLPHLKRIQSRMSLGRQTSAHLVHMQGDDFMMSTNSSKRQSLDINSANMAGNMSAANTPMNASSNNLTGRPRINTGFFGGNDGHNANSGSQSPAPMSPYFHHTSSQISRNSSFHTQSGNGTNQHNSLNYHQLLLHSHSLQGTPINRAPSVDGFNGSNAAGIADSEEQTKILLQHAAQITQNVELRAQIQTLLDTHLQHVHTHPDMVTNAHHNSIQVERMDTTQVYESYVALENYLWKKGKSVFHLLSKRYYLLAGNCMYYYAHKNDVRVKGVVFLTGCVIERKKDEEMELRGYYGFEVLHQDVCVAGTSSEHHRHEQRVLYCRSEEEREKWVTALQHAAHVVPIEDDYILGKELGRGRFSVVCECVHKVSNKHCAVKIIDKATIEPDEKSLLRTEIAVLKLVNHPNIIRLEGLYESKQYIYIVMEMLKGGELFERIVGRPRFTELEAAKLMRPLLESVSYLHDLGIVHRDLKPENILCGDELDDLKIADFGLSKMTLPKEKMDAACGTLSYVAPEVLTMQGYGKEADLWSVGVILFLLLCGKLPFDGEDHNEIIRSTIQADLKVNPNVWNRLSEDAKNMMTSLLNKNPKERITARDALRHPFIVNTLGAARRASMSALTPPPLTQSTSLSAANSNTTANANAAANNNSNGHAAAQLASATTSSPTLSNHNANAASAQANSVSSLSSPVGLTLSAFSSPTPNNTAGLAMNTTPPALIPPASATANAPSTANGVSGSVPAAANGDNGRCASPLSAAALQGIAEAAEAAR